MNNMDAENIAQKARKSISKFCYEECKAYCCRKGYLILDKDEVDVVTQGKRKQLEKDKMLKKIKNGKYSLYMGNYDFPCPSLKDNKCMIHNDPKRPKTCNDFPLFLQGKVIRLSLRCLAVKQDLFYPYVKQLVVLGYIVKKEDPNDDIEFNTINILNKKGDIIGESKKRVAQSS